LYKI